MQPSSSDVQVNGKDENNGRGQNQRDPIAIMSQRGFFIDKLHVTFDKWYCKMSSEKWWTSRVGSGDTWQEAVSDALEKVTLAAAEPAPWETARERNETESKTLVEELFPDL